jgi:hypothetical protein
MKPDPFEKRLQRQPLRPVPPDWRSDILAAARVARVARVARAPVCAVRPVPQSWLSTINYQLSTILWPHPKAWAGLAAVWVVIALLNVAMREDSAACVVAKLAPPSPEMLVELRQQQKLFAELVGPREEREADRSKAYKVHPRTEWMEITTA